MKHILLAVGMTTVLASCGMDQASTSEVNAAESATAKSSLTVDLLKNADGVFKQALVRIKGLSEKSLTCPTVSRTDSLVTTLCTSDGRSLKIVERKDNPNIEATYVASVNLVTKLACVLKTDASTNSDGLHIAYNCTGMTSPAAPAPESAFAVTKAAFEKGTLPTAADLAAVTMTGRCYQTDKKTTPYAAFFLGRKIDHSVDATSEPKFAALWQIRGKETQFDTLAVKDLDAMFAKAAKDWEKVTATRASGTSLESSVTLANVAGVFVENAKVSGKAILVKVENTKLPQHNAYCKFERNVP